MFYDVGRRERGGRKREREREKERERGREGEGGNERAESSFIFLDHNADWLRKAGFDHFVFLLEGKQMFNTLGVTIAHQAVD